MRPAPARRRFIRARVLVVAFAALVAILALAYVAGVGVRSHLAAGRADLLEAKQALIAGDVVAADEAFRGARDEFASAADAARGPIARLFTPLPVVGRTPDAMVAIAEAGRGVAEAGLAVTRGIASMPDGLATLAPRDHRVPLEALTSLTPTVAEAADLARSAQDILEAGATSLLVAPVADASREALAEVSSLAGTLADARTALERMPWFLGADAPRRYLFGAQNPAEMRGTGGLLGVYAILTIDQGQIRFSRFQPDTSAPNLPASQVEAPEDYERIYTQFGGAGFWLNANMTPDVPTAATALENLWAASGRGELDGVIFADPFALSEMLRATGPVDAPSLEVQLTADDVVGYVTNEIYSTFPDPTERKLALGEATHSVVDAFMTSSTSPDASFDALTAMLRSGHVQLYVDDPELEGVLAGGAAGGALVAPPGDFLAVVQNSAGGNKVDYYLDRTIEHEVRLGSDGTASGSTLIRLENDAPLRGAPQYVLGPYPGVSRRGENVMLLSTYCSRRCALTGKTAEGNVADYGTEIEAGLPFTWDLVRVPSGDTATISYTTAVDEAWTGDDFGGTYRFRLIEPPSIRPTSFRLSVTVPSGMEITSTSVPMDVAGGTATWVGTPDRVFDVEVRFRPSPLRRGWLFLWHVVTMPLVRF